MRPSSGSIRLLGLALAALLLLTFVSQASASRAPTRTESSAIKKVFFKTHDKATTKIASIRISTVDKRYSSVTYTISGPEPRQLKAAKTYKPAPVILKKGSKWKEVPVSKTPAKVKKDLKAKAPRSNIRISGDRTALLTRAARCTPGTGFASIYDPGSDTYLSIEFHGDYYKGPGRYPALGMGSVAGIQTNSATLLAFQTGQGNDYSQPTGDIYSDESGGVIEATMARADDPGNHYPQSVLVSGTWDCG